MTGPIDRRRLLTFALLAVAGGAGAASLAAPAPAVLLTDTAGRRRPLPELLQGRPTLVQLMFTGCGTVCPAQGLLFATLAARARPVPVQWLSISIDALGDDPARLKAWQARFGAHPDWLAAVPAPAEVDRLNDFLRGAPVKPGTHGTQVFVFDAAARLVHRTADNPSPAELEALIRRHAADA